MGYLASVHAVSDRLGAQRRCAATTRVLEFGTAHAAARDAVHTPLDAQALAGE
ncbi:ethanolamine ammonia-lyase light chain family protein [Mycobacteroides abscessus]|nr:ethanolamine ammonia-lyase light chain family protein [Mycobacteroides abscessus]